jgi:hypothetical protein
MKKIVIMLSILTIIMSTLICSSGAFAIPLPVADILGDAWDHNGTFEVGVGTTHTNFTWSKDGSLPAIDVKGTSYGMNITQLELIIPAGTKVTMNVGQTLYVLSVRMGLNDPLYWTYYTNIVYTNTYTNTAYPNTIKFSNDIIVNKLDASGSWVKIAQFNTLVNNIPQP